MTATQPNNACTLWCCRHVIFAQKSAAGTAEKTKHTHQDGRQPERERLTPRVHQTNKKSRASRPILLLLLLHLTAAPVPRPARRRRQRWLGIGVNFLQRGLPPCIQLHPPHPLQQHKLSIPRAPIPGPALDRPHHLRASLRAEGEQLSRGRRQVARSHDRLDSVRGRHHEPPRRLVDVRERRETDHAVLLPSSRGDPAAGPCELHEAFEAIAGLQEGGLWCANQVQESSRVNGRWRWWGNGVRTTLFLCRSRFRTGSKGVSGAAEQPSYIQG